MTSKKYSYYTLRRPLATIGEKKIDGETFVCPLKKSCGNFCPGELLSV